MASFWALVNLWKTSSKFSLKSVWVKHQATQKKQALYFFVIASFLFGWNKTVFNTYKLFQLSCVTEFSSINEFEFFVSLRVFPLISHKTADNLKTNCLNEGALL